jgi:polysaccharide biosynthesis/export protein
VKYRVSRVLYLLLASAAVAVSCAAPMANRDLTPSSAFVETARRYHKEYVLGNGDQIEIWVRRDPSVSRTCVIRGDGKISLPTVGEVTASGLTVPELDSLLTVRLSQRLDQPEVKVVVSSGRQPMVYVVGEVARAGPVALRDAQTAAQAVVVAGGMTHAAASRSVAVIRLTDEGRIRAYKVDASVGGQPGSYMGLQAMTLQADDIILVPENRRSQFGRLVDDYINKPLSGAMSILTPYVQLILIRQALK